MAKTVEVDTTGFLVWYTLTDVRVPYNDLHRFTADAGLDDAFLAPRTTKRGAWEKATNLRRPRALSLTDEFVASIEDEHGCEPTASIEAVLVKKQMPRARHLVRRLLIPDADDPEVARQEKAVALLRFDGGAASWEKRPGHNGSVDALLTTLRQEYEQQISHADGQEIRAAARTWLADHSALRLGSGGNYFIPVALADEGEMRAFRQWMLALLPYRVDAGKPIENSFVIITPDSDVGLGDIKEALIAEVRQEFQAVHDGVQDLSEIAVRYRDQRHDALAERFVVTCQMLEAFQESLQDEMAVLEAVKTMAQNAILSRTGEG